MKYRRVAERHSLIYERGLIWEGETSRGALISVADNMLIMICGDGDFRVNLRKRHEVDPRREFRVFERRRGEKYRGVPLRRIEVDHYSSNTMPMCLEPSWILETGLVFLYLIISTFCHGIFICTCLLLASHFFFFVHSVAIFLEYVRLTLTYTQKNTIFFTAFHLSIYGSRNL